MEENKFNLVDEPWINVESYGLVSLKSLFEKNTYKRICGTPIEKIAILKLLQGICQAAWTPTDEDEWKNGGEERLSKECLDYLEKYKDRFFLYGQRPFLQSPNIKDDKRTKKCSLGIINIESASENTTIWSQMQREKYLSDAEKAVMLITVMGFALGGKKWGNYYNPEKDEMKASPPSGISLQKGLLHSFCFGGTILQTLWLNLLEKEHLEGKYIQKDPPWTWESMPEPEISKDINSLSKEYAKSITGRLVPLSRFCFFGKDEKHEDIIYVTHGIFYPNSKDDAFDPSVSYGKKGPLMCDTKKRPWRNLPAMLSYLGGNKTQEQFSCFQLNIVLSRAVNASFITEVEIWSGGVQVSNKFGEEYFNADDDFVESSINIPRPIKPAWFDFFEGEIKFLEKISEELKNSIEEYYKHFVENDPKKERIIKNSIKKAQDKGELIFWQFCEKRLSNLVKACESSEEIAKIRNKFLLDVENTFNTVCHKNTARELDAWAAAFTDFKHKLIKEKNGSNR